MESVSKRRSWAISREKTSNGKDVHMYGLYMCAHVVVCASCMTWDACTNVPEIHCSLFVEP